MDVSSSCHPRRILVVFAVFLLVAGIVAGVLIYFLPPPLADKVILISVDTLRPDYLGCYDPSIQTTPAMDSLAEEGVLFEGALCNYPKTTPSHASMLSGLYTWSHGVRNNNQKIPDEVVLLPEILRAQAWTTGGFASLTTVMAVYGFNRGFDVYDDHLTIRGPASTGGHERRCLETIEPALKWLGLHREDKVFLFLHLGDPHGPYWPPKEYRDNLPPPDPKSTLPLGNSNYSRDAVPLYQIINDHNEVDFYKQRYQAEVRYVDDCMKTFFDRLKEWRIYDRSMIILTSDHGEAMGEHRMWFQHGSSLFYPQVRVPLVVVFPGSKPGRVKGIVESVDLAPTILDYLEMEIPLDMEGKSLLACLRDPDQPAKSSWYGDMNYLRGIEREGMKLLYHTYLKSYELFDVQADPEEKVDLSEEYLEMRDIMDRELVSFIKSRRGLKARPPTLTLEQRMEMEKNLRTLGYIE